MSDIAGGKTNSKEIIKSGLKNYSMFLILLLIMVVFSFLTNGINLSSRNITNIFIQYSYVLILAVGMVQMIITGNIDLSVGSVCAFIGAISAFVYNTGVGMPVTLLVSLAVGVAIGAFQGFWSAYMKMAAFIVTLAGMLLFRGLTYIITHVNPVSFKDDGYKQIASGMFDIPALVIGNVHYTAIIVGVIIFVIFAVSELVMMRKKKLDGYGTPPLPLTIVKIVLIGLLILGISQRFATYRGIPIVVVVLGITVLVFHFMMMNTILGRFIYAVGGNPRSAKLSGINSELINFIVFCIMGLLTGLAAVVSTGYMNTALPQAGNLFEMDAIAACYIGGVSAMGGIGTITGVIVGGLVMSAINNGMSLMNLGAHYQYVVKAVILLMAVFYDVYSRRKSGLG
jgi:putative multiple sugar transport system permease protein